MTEEEVTETTFHITCRIKRGTLDRSGSDSVDEDNYAARAVMWNQDPIETKNLLSIWDLVSQKSMRGIFESWRRQHKCSPAARGQELGQTRL